MNLLRRLILLTSLFLGGCLTAIASHDNTARARLGQTASLGLVRVTPLQVIEDSRCVQGVQCVWAGQVRVRASVESPGGEHERTLTLDQPQQIGGGTLLLEAVTPRRKAESPIPPRDYTFTLHYTVPSSR